MDQNQRFQKPQDSLISFHCKNCNQKIRVLKIHAGKKAKCPKCKNAIFIPKPKDTIPIANQTDSADSSTASKDSLLDPDIFDVPPEFLKQSPDERESYGLEQLQKLRGQFRTIEPEPIPQRKLPWLIDIFLYPTSKPGLITLGIIVGIPMLINITLWFFFLFAIYSPPLLVFVILLAIISFFIITTLYLYLFWYYCECIRDSAAGQIRAPETIATTPGLGEMFWQMLRVIGCVIFFFSPALTYFYYTGGTDRTFWLLLAYACFFCPMGLLSVLIFNSIAGLNPILLIGSIFSTFFPYIGLVIFFYAFGIFVSITSQFLFGGAILLKSWILIYISQFISIYLLMVGAHLLGRFYWRYQEKLNWDV